MDEDNEEWAKEYAKRRDTWWLGHVFDEPDELVKYLGFTDGEEYFTLHRDEYCDGDGPRRALIMRLKVRLPTIVTEKIQQAFYHIPVVMILSDMVKPIVDEMIQEFIMERKLLFDSVTGGKETIRLGVEKAERREEFKHLHAFFTYPNTKLIPGTRHYTCWEGAWVSTHVDPEDVTPETTKKYDEQIAELKKRYAELCREFLAQE